MAKQSRCEDCMNYVYDEEYDCYTCEQGAELDEEKWPNSCAGTTPPVRSTIPARATTISPPSSKKKGQTPFFLFGMVLTTFILFISIFEESFKFFEIGDTRTWRSAILSHF